jgi:uncharacterized membrane protein YjfL (UPF0719 family)
LPAPAAAGGLARAAQLLAFGMLLGPGVDGALAEAALRDGLVWAAAFSACGLLSVALGTRVANRLFLPGLGRAVREGNLAAAVVAAGHALAMGILASRCYSGHGLALLGISAAFFALGTGTLLGLQALYRWRTRYADDEEVRGENVAAAVAFAGVTVALALIVGHAAAGPFLGWRDSLAAYGRALLLGLALYPVRQLVVGPLLLRIGGRSGAAAGAAAIDRQVALHRDVAAAAVEALAYVAVALVATGLG